MYRTLTLTTSAFFTLRKFLRTRDMLENGRRESTKRVRRRAKVREGIVIDGVVTFALPGFEWNRSDAYVRLSSRRCLYLASTKLPHSKP